MPFRVSPALTFAAALALAALALLTLAPHLSGAELWQYDEWYTAERVHGILSRHDWLTLYENGLPVFKKPPLQYWLSAAFVRAEVPALLALRLPSYLAAFGVLALTAHLARSLSGKAVATPVALVLLLSSTQFWVSASSAMLDMGAALLLTAAIAAMFAAWRSPRWWWVVALALGLAALQKAPTALVALPLAALAMRTRPAPLGRHKGALLLALALLIVWPVTQWALHGMASVERTYLTEQLMRITPGHRDWARHFRWAEWVAADGALLWAGLVLGSLALPLLDNRPETRAAALLVFGFFLALTLADGELFDRYLMQVLPLAAATSAAALARLKPANGLIAAAILTIATGGPLKPPRDAGLENAGIAPYRALLQDFRASLTPQDQPVVCGWEKSDLTLFPGALWLIASGDKPFRRVWSVEDISSAIASGNIAPPVRGICTVSEYAALSAALPTRAIGADAGFVHWAYP